MSPTLGLRRLRCFFSPVLTYTLKLRFLTSFCRPSIPSEWHPHLSDLVLLMLCKDPTKRIAMAGIRVSLSPHCFMRFLRSYRNISGSPKKGRSR